MICVSCLPDTSSQCSVTDTRSCSHLAQNYFLWTPSMCWANARRTLATTFIKYGEKTATLWIHYATSCESLAIVNAMLVLPSEYLTLKGNGSHVACFWNLLIHVKYTRWNRDWQVVNWASLYTLLPSNRNVAAAWNPWICVLSTLELNAAQVHFYK